MGRQSRAKRERRRRKAEQAHNQRAKGRASKATKVAGAASARPTARGYGALRLPSWEQRDWWMKAAAPWAIGALACAAVALVSALWSPRPVSAPISASLTRTGGVDIGFSGAPSKSTSPVCGCDRLKPIGDWRGLTLPASELELQRTGQGESTTRYSIFSAPASLWTAAPVHRGMKATVLVVDVKEGVAVSHRLLSGDQRGPRRVIARRTLYVDALAVESTSTVRVSSTSPEPVAALSVPKDGRASIRYDGPPATPGDVTLSVRVPYQAQPELRTQPQVADAVPVLDVLGPSVAMWGELLNSVDYVYSATRVPRPLSGGAQEEFAMELKTLVGSSDPPAAGWRRYFHVKTSDSLFALRVVPHPVASDGTLAPLDGSGEPLDALAVRAPRVVSQAEKLVPVFAKANKNPRITMRKLPFIPFTNGGPPERYVGDEPGQAAYEFHDEEFQLPPTPPVSGLNVFGSMRYLKLSGGVGTLNVGADSAREYPSPSAMEFRDLSQGATGRHSVIPVEVDRGDAKIDVRGRADVRINGQPIEMSQPLMAKVISSDVLLFIATIAAAVTFGTSLRVARKRDPTIPA